MNLSTRFSFAPLFFFLSFLVSSASAQYPTRGQVYDFDVGDQFQYEEYDHWWGGPPTYYTNTITGKNFSNGSNTVTYDVDVEKLELNLSTFQWDSITTYSNQLIFSQLSDTIAGDVVTPFTFFLISDTTYIDPLMYNRQTVAFGYENGQPLSAAVERYRWVVGVGRTHYAVQGSDLDYDLESNLIWYQKGNEIWGVRQLVGMEEEVLPRVKIWPNPTNGVVSIEGWEAQYGEWILLDRMGRMIKSGVLRSGETQLDLNEVSSGIYFLQISDSNGMHQLLRKISIQ